MSPGIARLGGSRTRAARQRGDAIGAAGATWAQPELPGGRLRRADLARLEQRAANRARGGPNPGGRRVMAAQALALLREVSRLEAPLEELRALQSLLQSVPLGELREQAAELRLGPLFSLLNENHR